MKTPDDDDKTRVLQRSAKHNENEDNAVFSSKKPADNDKTQMAAKRTPSGDRTRLAAKKVVDDKTRIALKRKTRQQADDKTRFVKPKTRVAPDDKTRMQGKTNPSRSTGKVKLESSDSPQHNILKNRFVLEKVLGAGGMGVVYKAKDLLKVEAKDRDPYVAIKVLSDEFKSHPEAFIALQRESRKSQRIAHPNIVNVHDFDKDDSTVFMTMEFLDGEPLDRLMRQYKGSGLPTEEVYNILKDISSALIHAHQENVIHSDFKPGNIFVTNKGVTKVFDFGIARAVAKAEQHEESKDDRTVFDAGNLGALTPAYASYEMLEGEVPDVRDDIYALGCIAYELYTGEHPFKRLHANEAQRQNLKPKRIGALNKNQWLAIEKALAFKRDGRLASVKEFWELFNKKGTLFTKISAVAMLALIAAVAATLQYWQPPTESVSEAEVRNELEYEIRLELRKDTIDNLLTKPDFSEDWQANLWSEIQSVRDMLDPRDTWLVATEARIFDLYIQQIAAHLQELRLEQAQLTITNAYRYAKDNSLLKEQESMLAAAIEQQEQQRLEAEREQELARQEQEKQARIAKEVVERRSKFGVALGTVNEQLACRGKLSMRDLDIAIKKLRSLNLKRYKKNESKIVNSLADCLVQIGLAFPERAREDKKYALRIFPSNRTIIAVKIIPRDPCDISLAGLGSRGKRATCKDKIPGVGNGPAMVVVPPKGSLEAFAIGKYEVSIGELNLFCKVSNVCREMADKNNHLPATDLSAEVAKQYLKWLSSKTERKYRLPTTTEWSYAAKAGSRKLDPNRNCKLSTRGIRKGEALVKASVGEQNKWGVVNHIGNANEWVLDKSGKLSVLGGSYETPMEDCNFNSLIKHNGQPDKTIGFRVLREMKKK